MAFSSSQIFFLQHNGGPEFEAFFTTSYVAAVVTGGYLAQGGISTGTVRGGRSAIGTQKQYNRCKQAACKPGGHRPPSLQSNRNDMHRRLSHSHQSLGLNISGQVPEGVVVTVKPAYNKEITRSKDLRCRQRLELLWRQGLYSSLAPVAFTEGTQFSMSTKRGSCRTTQGTYTYDLGITPIRSQAGGCLTTKKRKRL
ncbi:hypothetical protein CY35_04G000600 [Sphagnum magellanicum]|nr:hypothetical protein CY35_04G000600 [Sphagnum magellanicum]